MFQDIIISLPTPVTYNMDCLKIEQLPVGLQQRRRSFNGARLHLSNQKVHRGARILSRYTIVIIVLNNIAKLQHLVQ